MNLSELSGLAQSIRAEIAKAIVGQDAIVDHMRHALAA